jgi:GT2 family glycosyltransferase
VTQKFNDGFEVIVIDSAADEKVAAVVKQYPTVRMVRSAEVLLPRQGRNLGVRHARGTHLVFLDADCVPEPGWLAEAVAALEAGAKLVGGPVLHGSPWHPVAVIDNLLQFSDVAPGRPRGTVKLLPSCNLAIAQADFEQLGGFPPASAGDGILPAGEDVLFCYQAARRWGGRLLYVPGMRIRHFGRTGLRQMWGHQELFGFVRAVYSLELSPMQRRLGRFAVIAPAVGLKRLSYLVRRAAAWNPLSLAYMALLLPILLYGLAAWCYGFYRGCQRYTDEK